MRDIFEDIFAELSRSTRWRRRGAACGRACGARFYQNATVGEGRRRLSGAARRQAGAHAGAAPLAAPVRAWREAIAAEWQRAARRDRSGRHAADAARQLDHRRRGAAPRRSPPRSRNISAPICCSTAPTSRKVCVARQAEHWDPGAGMGARSVRRALRAGRRRGACARSRAEAIAAVRAAIPSARTRPSLAARRAATSSPRSPARRCSRWRCRRPARRRRGLGGGACRRGLEHGVLGPRRARARAPRVPLRRAAGGGSGASLLTCSDRLRHLCRPRAAIRVNTSVHSTGLALPEQLRTSDTTGVSLAAQRASASRRHAGSAANTGRASAPARCATAVSQVTIRSSCVITAAVSRNSVARRIGVGVEHLDACRGTATARDLARAAAPFCSEISRTPGMLGERRERPSGMSRWRPNQLRAGPVAQLIPILKPSRAELARPRRRPAPARPRDRAPFAGIVSGLMPSTPGTLISGSQRIGRPLTAQRVGEASRSSRPQASRAAAASPPTPGCVTSMPRAASTGAKRQNWIVSPRPLFGERARAALRRSGSPVQRG